MGGGERVLTYDPCPPPCLPLQASPALPCPEIRYGAGIAVFHFMFGEDAEPFLGPEQLQELSGDMSLARIQAAGFMAASKGVTWPGGKAEAEKQYGPALLAAVEGLLRMDQGERFGIRQVGQRGRWAPVLQVDVCPALPWA